MSRVIVVGAGISGLAASTFLDDPDLDLTVLEAAPRAGGNVRSVREYGRVLDVAANGWLDNEPAMGRLLERTGLAGEVVRASDKFKERWIFADGRMHAAPLGPLAMVTTRLIPWRAKLRMLLEPFIPRGLEARDPGEVDHESVGAWVERRLGPWFVDRMVGPMVAGIYAADPFDVSLRAAFPRMHELERDYRSLFLAMFRLRRGGQPSGHLTTLPGGAGALTEALAARLGSRLQTGVEVTGLERRGDGWRVLTAGGALEADAVVLASPAYASAKLVGELDPDAAVALADIPYSPVSVVVSAWPEGAWERDPQGFGVLVARGEELGGVLGSVFTSCIFPDQAPADEILLRTLVGGGVHPEAAALPDDELIARARHAHEAFFGKEKSEPREVRIFRHRRGIPAYTPGHLGRVAVIRGAESRRSGLFFTGNHLRGIGVKDCARQGEELALRVREHLAGSPAEHRREEARSA